MKTQRGAALVEFAIIALLFFIILFGIIEFGRAWFTYNTLVEATRRGARVAAVCPASTTGITQVKQVTVFNAPTGTLTTNTGLVGLKETDVVVKYLNSSLELSPAVVASDGSNGSPTSLASDIDEKYDSIAFVRVQITGIDGNNQIGLIIPGLSLFVPVPPIVTTLPAESLGRTSPVNPATRSCAFS